MKSHQNTTYPFDCAGVYEIHVVGDVDPTLVEYLGGMTSVREETTAGSDELVTVLTSWLPDQAALNGVLNALYDRRYTLTMVRRVEGNADSKPA